MHIDTYEHAPQWIKDSIHRVPFEVFAIIRAEDNFNKSMYWRDKTDLVKQLMVGFGDPDGEVQERVVSGKELIENGRALEGVAVAFNYKIMWK